MAKIKIQDESGDKKYFTQLPSIILNHSTANDQALYWQMKRYAGEDGKCFATQKTLMKKLGIGEKAYKKSLEYLLEKKWIKYVGLTGGKTRPVKTYSIVDIWKQNIIEYEKISSESRLSFEEISSESRVDKSQKQTKISSESSIEEEPLEEEHNNNILFAPNGAEEIIPDLLKDKQRHVRIIGVYAKFKNVAFISVGQQRSFIVRNVRAAKNLADYENKKITETMLWLKNNADFKWTLETVGKYVDENLEHLSLKGKTEEQQLDYLLKK